MPPRLTPAPKPSPSASLSAQPRRTVRSPAGYAADASIRQAPNARWSYIAYAVVVGVLLMLPLLLSDFRLALVGKYLAFAVAAVGLDLLWGYAGVLSLGHGVFFSLGAYSMAMHMKLQSEELPDFMVWSGLEQLPWFWEPFRHFAVALPMAVVIPALFAIIVGYPTFRSGIRGVYLLKTLIPASACLLLLQTGLLAVREIQRLTASGGNPTDIAHG